MKITLKTTLQNKRTELKNELANLLDELANYAYKNKSELFPEWYIKIREIHDVCLIVDFIESIIDDSEN